MLNRLIDWVTVEPTISLLMTITAIVIFGSAFRRSKEIPEKFWPLLRTFVGALLEVLLFLGLLWTFRAILNNNIVTFFSTHGSLSELSRSSAQSIWGRPHVQRELEIDHYREYTVQEEIPREDLSEEPVYKTVEVREAVPQNSIIGFRGDIYLTASEREKGYALYSGYIIDATYEYRVINHSEYETEAIFSFPLSPDQTMHEDFQITVNGEDIGSDLEIYIKDRVSWTDYMKPGEEFTIVVSYTSRGMDTYYYQIPTQRNIQDFALTLTIDRLPVDLINYPDLCLTPTNIRATADGEGSILTWELDDAITKAGMGVSFPQPEQPGAKVLRVLVNSPYAITLLATMLALTLLILGRPVQFIDLALLSAAYCVQFLIMASVSDFFFGFWGSLILGIALTGAMTYLLFRRLTSKLLRVLIYILVAFFAIVYPLSGFLSLPAHVNAFDNLVMVGLIVYLFGLSLYARVTSGNHLSPS